MDIKTIDNRVIVDDAVITEDISDQIVYFQKDKNALTIQYRECLSQVITKLILSCDGGANSLSDMKYLLLHLCYLRDALEVFMIE